MAKYEKVCVLCKNRFNTSNKKIVLCEDTHSCRFCDAQLVGRSKKTCGKKECADKMSAIVAKERYGDAHPSKSLAAREKAKKTNLERYGATSPMKNEAVKSKVAETNLKKYGSKAPAGSEEVKKKIRETNTERYGVESTLSDPETRKKIAETNLEKHGAANPFGSKEVQEKIKSKNLEKFGVENPAQAEVTKAKIAETNLERYGVKRALDNPEIKAKAVETLMKNYGVDNPGKSEAIRERSRQTTLEKYGVEHLRQDKERLLDWGAMSLKVSDKDFIKTLEEWPSLHGRKPTLKELQLHFGYASPSTLGKRAIDLNVAHLIDKTESYLEILMKNFLDELGVEYIRHDRTVLKPQELDFYLPEHKLAIEVNDFLTHNSTVNPWGGPPKSKKYHFEKTIACREAGVRLIHAWEHQILLPQKFEVLKNAIRHACGLTEQKAAARSTRVEIRKAIEMKKFFEANNIAGYKGAAQAFVLVDRKTGEDLMCYIVGKTHFGRQKGAKYDLEIVRGATKLGWSVTGGASKLWQVILRETGAESIVYYVDLNTYDGGSLSFLEGAELVSEQASFKNYWVDEGVLRNRNPSKHKEIMELTRKGKIWTVWDAGTQTWVWKADAAAQQQ